MSNGYKAALARFEAAVRAHAFIGTLEAGSPRRDELEEELQVSRAALVRKLQYRAPAPAPDNWERFPDGKLKPFLTPERYNDLRDDDRFLYNRGPKPEGLE